MSAGIALEGEFLVPVAGILWGFYEVSNLGRVKSLARKSSHKYPFTVKGKIMKGSILPNGYHDVTLCVNGNRRTRLFHSLVMEAFVGPRPLGQEVRHLDGNPRNNCLSNLRYGSHVENVNDTLRHGRVLRGENQPNSKLSEEQAEEILCSRLTAAVLARKYGVSSSTIYDIRNDRTWKYILRPENVLRSRSGDNNPSKKKLNREQVLEILHSPLNQPSLARKFGVDQSVISNIRRGRSWKHVPRPSVATLNGQAA